MKQLAFFALLLAAPAFAATPAPGAPEGKMIFLHGNQNGAMPCAACHGAEAKGNSSIGAPQLAGLPAGVISSDLANFANGGGGNATMQYIAQALSPAEAAAVAQYLSSLPK